MPGLNRRSGTTCLQVCRASDCRASLSQVLSEPWRLSTSQIAQFQIRMFDPNKYPKHLGAGGGFGPVSALEGGQVGGTRGQGCHWRVQGLKEVRPEARAQALDLPGMGTEWVPVDLLGGEWMGPHPCQHPLLE